MNSDRAGGFRNRIICSFVIKIKNGGKKQWQVIWKIHRENHNLDRCRTQFKLVSDMEAQFEAMAAVVRKYA